LIEGVTASDLNGHRESEFIYSRSGGASRSRRRKRGRQYELREGQFHDCSVCFGGKGEK
jgi:hypothetical protein